jgi:hypothetical protein
MSAASAAELVFDPANDFQVLEEFEFKEDVQRPEAIRFFTYEEQASDFVEKLLPTQGRIAKAVIRKAEYEVDSFTKLYKRAVKETTEGFAQTEYVRPVTLPWVHYGHTGEPQVTDYNWFQRWAPLYEDGAGMAPNYYLLLLDALPKSAVYFEGGDGVPVFVNGTSEIEDRYVLDRFPYTRTNHREDGTYTISRVFREDTGDTARFTHYIVDNPPLTPPNPLTDHPFLSVHPDPVKLESTEPLPELLPTMEAIFDHAVPETNDPYTEGLKYMKIYDINLRDVPNALWTRKFPPVAVVDESPPPQELSFQTKEEDSPSKTLLDAYKTKWYSSLSSRKWLSVQSDGGSLVPLMLLSQAGDVGVNAIPPPVVLPESGPIEGTPEDCLPPEITGFSDFQTRGIYRAPKCASCGAVGHSGLTCPTKKVTVEYLVGYGCVPLQFVHKEREDAPYHGRLPWTPGTHDRILKEHLDLLEKHREYRTELFTKNLAATPASMENETRIMIVSILQDEMKADEDKLYEIQALIRDAPLKDHVYLDPETSVFLVCEHELEILKGTYAKTPREFLKTWCEKESGYYVCRYSGERISAIFEDQDQFDEEGRVMKRIGKLDIGKAGEHVHIGFAEELKQMQTVFKSNHPAEDLMYLLISLIQVLPSEDQLKPLLDYLRSESAKVQARITGKKLSSKQQGDVDMALSLFGFNAIIVLLQIHRPQLIPRRSFGSKPLLLRGFPRDTDDINDSPLVDSLMNALTQTFESYPGTFKGSSVIFLRTLLNDRKGTRRVILSSLQKQFAPRFSKELQIAKESVQAVAVGTGTGTGTGQRQAFDPPMVHMTRDITFLAPGDRLNTEAETRYTCKVGTPWLIPSTRFSYTQESLEIVQPLRPSNKSRKIVPPTPPASAGAVTPEDVRRRLKLKPIETLKRILAEETRPGVLQAFLLRIYGILAEETISSRALRTYIDASRTAVEQAVGDPSLRRDIYKGFILELGTKVAENEAVLTQFQSVLKTDSSLKSLLSSAAETRSAVDRYTTREREVFKSRMRNMTDTQREITNTLRDLGLAPYLITKEDRDGFVREIQAETEVPEPDNPLVAPGERENPGDVPEEGLNDERDVGPQGEVPQNGDAEVGYDYGDYGDMRARVANAEEFVEQAAYNYDEDI